jgi:hypothetical protein
MRQFQRDRFIVLGTLTISTAVVFLSLLFTVDWQAVSRALRSTNFPQSLIATNEVLQVVIAIVAVIAVGTVPLFRYLRTESDDDVRKNLSGDVRYLAKSLEVRRLRERLTRLEAAKAGVDADASDRLVESLRTQLVTSATADIDGALGEKYGPAKEIMSRVTYVRQRVDTLINRLEQEIRALVKRGNVNLLLGIAITILAVSILGYVALGPTISAENWRNLLPSYLLRLSLVVFVEIFAFFFLRLYRTTLSEIKYFHNEISNFEAKALALEVAMIAASPELVTRATEELARTERNFVLSKDQTTVDLERARLDGQHVKELTGVVSQWLQERRIKYPPRVHH